MALLRLCFVCAALWGASASFVFLLRVWLCCVVALLYGGSAVWLFCFVGDSAPWLLCFVASAVLRGFCPASWLLPCFVASALLRSFCSALWLLLSLWGLLLCFVLALTFARSSFHFAGVNIAHTSQRGATSVDWLPGLVFVNTTNDESSVPWTWPVKSVVSTEEASLKYSG